MAEGILFELTIGEKSEGDSLRLMRDWLVRGSMDMSPRSLAARLATTPPWGEEGERDLFSSKGIWALMEALPVDGVENWPFRQSVSYRDSGSFASLDAVLGAAFERVSITVGGVGYRSLVRCQCHRRA